MRSKGIIIFSALAALASVALLPWLAYREAMRQAYETEAGIAVAYARDALHRSDEKARQAFAGLDRLARLRSAPCSPEALALMREIALTSTYVKAIGPVRDGIMLCSSMGAGPVALGGHTFRNRTGLLFYLDVPMDAGGPSPLMAVERGGFAVLSNRDLALDTWGAHSGASVTVVHLDRPAGARAPATRGFIDRRWVERIGRHDDVTFVDGGHLVALTRSQRYRTAAIAAVPAARIAERTSKLALRLVPAGVAAGALLAIAILLLARRQQSVAAALRYALRANEFFLEYQPMVDVATGRCMGAEALLRMRRGSGELIGPDLFIPIAEEIGLITRLTERVFELMENDAGDYLRTHPGFHIALNVSGDDLRSDHVLSLINGFLARTGTQPSNLIIEITERAFVDPKVARAAIDGLRARGVEVAIDDFGTGYSSLSNLESLELDLLKIDRSFVESIGTGAPTSQVVEHIIAMACTIGLRMIAEGIETTAQAEFVRERGVEYAQGWLFGRPMPFADLEQMLAGQGVAPLSPAASH